jgi:hypothetical protein
MATKSSLKTVRKKKYPKMPKKRASVKSWDTYEKKVREVNKHNDAVERELARREKIVKLKD